MQYLLLIYHNEAEWAKKNQAEAEPIYLQYRALREDLQKKGKYVGGSQLKPTATATTVRVRNGKRLTTDGPFAETKEQLGGFFLIDASDLDEALSVAARIPAAQEGSIEVRPLVAQAQTAPA
jgi:hypothetical protein